VDVRINDRGLELLARIDVDQNAPFDRMKGAITDEEAHILSEILDRLRAC
jgi:hypothetical protein